MMHDDVLETEPASPILFGNAASQGLLIRAFVDGSIRKPPRYRAPLALALSGLLLEFGRNSDSRLMLNARHPAVEALRAVLTDLTGAAGCAQLDPGRSVREKQIDASKPLAHRVGTSFEVILCVAQAAEPVPLDMLHRRIRKEPSTTCAQLLRDGVLKLDSSGVMLAPAVPDSYRRLVLELGSLLSQRDPRIARLTAEYEARPSAFVRSKDGAPRIFGTDVRLRNMMALAKYGALHAAELGRVIPGSGAVEETSGNAPFGRGAPVRTWETQHGLAAELDPAHPVAVPLRRFLLKMEERYPLPPFMPLHEKPKPPSLAPWKGDRLALFGSPIPTSILMTIGVLGWTFEALCCEAATGYDRVVVKKALKRLEDEGIIKGSRERRPGFNVRAVKLAENLCAREELDALLKACVEAWPMYADSVNKAMDHLRPRTKEHLRRRTLLKPTIALDPAALAARQRCVNEYRAVSIKLGYSPNTLVLSKSNSNLYRRIRRSWGTFRAFRKHTGLEVPRPGTSIRPNAALRDRCIREYAELSLELGHQPNSRELNEKDAWLGERIRVQWGGFPEFCEELALAPARRHRSAKANESARRHACKTEYHDLHLRLGYAPSSWELRLHTDGLYKRIKKVWPSFEAFCDELGVAPARMRRKESAT